jgi:hypothetical protein
LIFVPIRVYKKKFEEGIVFKTKISDIDFYLIKQVYILHIRKRHPEISLNIISSICENPDIIYREFESKDYVFEKKIEGINYRLIASKDRYEKWLKNKRIIKTCFSVNKDFHENAKIVYKKVWTGVESN